MIRFNLLQLDLIENFIPIVEQERRNQEDRFLQYAICYFLAGIAVAWIVSAVSKPPVHPLKEKEEKQL